MKALLLRIYDWMGTHRRVLWSVFPTILALLVVSAATLHYSEDIMDFLPVTEEDREALEAYQSQEIASRLVLIVEGEDEYLRNEAIEACEAAIPGLETDIDPTEQIEALYDLMPYYITDSTYAQFDSLFTPEAIRAALQRDKTILSTPGTSFLAPAIQHDPLGLVDLASSHHVITATNRSYAFYDSPYGGTETIKNAPLVDSLTNAVEQIANGFPELNIRWMGAPVVSVANARRIKLDTVLCVSLSVVLIVALLLYAFPRRKDILLVLLSISFGWLVGMAVLRIFTPSVSVVVLGIGSVLIGIAVNYPLHLLIHQRYTTSVRQTLDEVLSPLVVGNITTVGAFLTLVPLQAVALRDLGIFAASMLVGTILFCIFILPHLMSAEPTPVREIKVNGERLKVNGEWLKKAGTWSVVGLTVLFGVYLFYLSITGKNSPLFDSNLHNINYITAQQDADMESFELQSGDAALWTNYWETHDAEELIANVQAISVQEGFKPEAFDPFYATLRTWKPIKAFDTGDIAARLSDDFDYIGLCCSVIVFLFLWLSFRSIWLALIAFMPMVLSWVWIFAIMQFFGLHFNIVNIILATFIFGQGDDYTIFIVEGLLFEHQTGKPMLPQYKQSIILSALIMLVGIGILVLAVHPAMHSLGVVTLVGMSIVLLMAMTIPPLLFKAYVKWIARRVVQ